MTVLLRVLPVFVATMLATSALRAQVPLMKTQAPGFYRFMLGDFEITALNDGVIAYDSKAVLPTAGADEIARRLFESGLTDPVGMSYNGFLVNTGTKLVLIDVGTGGKLSDNPGFRGAGRLIANMRAAGYSPEQVDEIYITHFGPDHIGALTQVSGEARFPKAKVRASRAEVAAFLDARVPQQGDSVIRAFRDSLFAPYIKQGRFEQIDGDIELTPGIRALATPGHTPGHTTYIVESRGEAILILGDVIHLGAIQFARPDLPTVFDADQTKGAEQRGRIFRLASEKNYWVAGAHLPFPGIGHIRRDRGRYRWAPVSYAIPQ